MELFAVSSLAGLIFLFLSICIFTVFRRAYSNRVDRKMTELQNVYDGLVKAVRAGQTDPRGIAAAVPAKHFSYFERYLRNTISDTGNIDVSAQRVVAEECGFADDRRMLAVRSHGWTQAIAVRTLSYLRNPGDIPLFRKVLARTRFDPCISSSALGLALCGDIESLRSIVTRLSESKARNRDLLMTVLHAFGSSAASSLHEFLEENFLPVTEACVLVDLLGYYRHRASKPLLEKLLRETRSAEVRIHTIEALGQVGDEATCDLLLPLLEDGNFRVRLKALHAVGELGGEKKVDRIAQSLRDDNRWVRRNAAEALYFIGPPGIRRLEQTARQVDSAATQSAALILSEMKFRKQRRRYRHDSPAA